MNTALPGNRRPVLVSVGFGREPAEASVVAFAPEAEPETGAAVAERLKADFAAVAVAAVAALHQVELCSPGGALEPGKSGEPSEVSCCSQQLVDCSKSAAGEQVGRQAG